MKTDVGTWSSLPFTPPIPCSKNATDTCQLKMDIKAPTLGGPWPLLVLVPGGPNAPEDSNYLRSAGGLTVLASQGAVAISIDWRQSNYYGGGYPTSFEDVACAIGVAREIGPAYGASPDRVTLVGHSLGGWAAAVIALTPSAFTPAPGSCDPMAGSLRPDALVILAGVVDEVTAQEDGADFVTAFLGGDRTTHPDAWVAADPFGLAKRYPAGSDAIPIALVQGGADTNVPPRVARSFQAALVAAGYHSRLVEVPSADHGGILDATETIDTIMSIATGN